MGQTPDLFEPYFYFKELEGKVRQVCSVFLGFWNVRIREILGHWGLDMANLWKRKCDSKVKQAARLRPPVCDYSPNDSVRRRSWPSTE